MQLNEAGQPIGDPIVWSPRPPVRPVTLEGRTCRVVPWSHAHLGGLYDALVVRSPDTLWTYLPIPPPAGPEQLAAWLDGLAADPSAVPQVICLPDGSAVGTASYLRLDHVNGSVEVGCIALGAELQRTTPATEGLFLMMRHAFDDLGYRRYEWKCDSLNAPSRAAAARFGFVSEGRFRNALVYKGRSRDTDWFSITDAEWPALRTAYEAWLNPENFDDEGRQRRSLADLRGLAG